MSGKVVLSVAACSLIAGGIWGYGLHPDTKVETKHSVKIIRIPKYITHVKKETKEVVKHVGFPESCETAIDYGKLSTDQSNKVSNHTKDLLDFIDEFDVKVLNGENAVHSTEEGVGERVNRIDFLNYELLELNGKAESFYSVCKTDLEKAEAGDDFDAADGRHVESP